MPMIAAYIQQDDVMSQVLTVKECLLFAAKLKLSCSYEQKLQRVDRIIDELKLNKC